MPEKLQAIQNGEVTAPAAGKLDTTTTETEGANAAGGLGARRIAPWWQKYKCRRPYWGAGQWFLVICGILVCGISVGMYFSGAPSGSTGGRPWKGGGASQALTDERHVEMSDVVAEESK